jgi:hypothetical protein
MITCEIVVCCLFGNFDCDSFIYTTEPHGIYIFSPYVEINQIYFVFLRQNGYIISIYLAVVFLLSKTYLSISCIADGSFKFFPLHVTDLPDYTAS